MNIIGLTATIEALLFAAGKPLEVSELAEITEQSEANVTEALENLKTRLDSDSCGICLIKLENAYQLTTKKEYYDYLVRMVAPVQKSMLSGAALETLSIVAYNQPVTRSGVEFIRGVNSDSAINRLIERGLIEECGRLDTPGKPLIYRTTPEFLKSFGISSLDELPDISNIPIQMSFYDV